MPKINPINWRLLSKIFELFGCKFERQKGDHMVYSHPSARRPVIIPKYDEIPVSIIRINMKTVGMIREQYFELLKKC
ncbi:MAG TPA: type II toxin-antitoxin system HicA family toxin [bacterium]